MAEPHDRTRANVRYNSGDPAGVRSGYENPDVPSDISIPSCVIEDVDRGMMALFDDTISFRVSARDETMSAVPVIFATGERFAMLNRNKPIRDKEGKLILPLISIRRSGIMQGPEDIAGRGINQHTGDMLIKRRLGVDDRLYQRIVNKLGITNQPGLANFGGEPDPTGTEEPTGAALQDPDIGAGAIMKPVLGNNVFELLSIPEPQFYTAKYEVTFWTQYTVQMNEMLEQLMLAQLPQGKAFRLNTEKGYWFVLYLDDDKSSGDNFEDFTEKERMVKYSFSCHVPAYLIAGDQPGLPVPVRRTFSAPRIRFDVNQLQDGQPVADPALQADDPSDPFVLTGEAGKREPSVSPRQAAAHQGRLVDVRGHDGKLRKSFVRVLQENQSVGETVYSADGLVKFDNI